MRICPGLVDVPSLSKTNGDQACQEHAQREMKKEEPGPTSQDEWMKEIIRVAVGTDLRRGNS